MVNSSAHKSLSIYRSAVTEADGQAVNVWYLGIFWVGITLLPVVSVMTFGAVVEAWNAKDHVFPYQALGTGVGLIITAFTVGITAIAAAMRGQAGQQP